MYTYDDVCRSNHNGIPRINNALSESRALARRVVVNAREINNRAFVRAHDATHVCARRAHTCVALSFEMGARVHARTHSRI